MFTKLKALAFSVAIVAAAQSSMAQGLSLDPQTAALDAVSPNPNESYLDGIRPVGLSLTESWRSKYVLSNGVVAYDHSVAQTDIFLTTKCGLTLDLWGSIPTNLEDIGKDFGTEDDLTIGYTRDLKWFSVAVGVSYYDLHRNFTFDGSDLIVPYLELSKEFKVTKKLCLTPFYKAEMNFNLSGSIKGDTFQRVGVRYGWEVTKYLTLAGQTYMLYDPGVLGDTAFVGSIEGSAVWNLGWHNVKVELPFLRYEGPVTGVSDGRKPEFICGAGVSVSF